MKLIITFIFALEIIPSFSKNNIDTLWYDKDWKSINREAAVYYRPKPEKQNDLYKISDYYKSGSLQFSGYSYSSVKDSFEGKTIYYYETGAIQQIVLFRNNIPIDTIYYFYENGKLKAKVPINAGKINGKTFRYDESGYLISTEEYLANSLNGIKLLYYEDGNIKGKFIYSNGQLTDTAFGFFHDGELEQITVYQNGIKFGTHMRFFGNGNIEECIEFINDLYEGVAYKYFDNGKLNQRIEFQNNKKNGEHSYYNETGKISEVYNYRNDTLDGISTSYFNNGNVYKCINYKNGLKEGMYKEYNIDGTILIDCWYENDKPTDSCVLNEYSYSGEVIGSKPVDYITYMNKYILNNIKHISNNIRGSDRKVELKNQNGNTVVTGEISYSKFQGEWKYFDDDGTLQMSEEYENGQLEGYRKIYNNSGAVIKQVPYHNGKIHGIVLEFNPVNVKTEIYFVNDIQINSKSEYHSKMNSFKYYENQSLKPNYSSTGNGAIGNSKLYIKFDTTYFNSSISDERIIHLSNTLTKSKLETETKDFDVLILTIRNLNNKFEQNYDSIKYIPKQNEIVLFCYGNMTKIYYKDVIIKAGNKVYSAIDNHSLLLNKLAAIYNAALFKSYFDDEMLMHLISSSR